MPTPTTSCAGPDGATIKDLIAGLPYYLSYAPENSAVFVAFDEQQRVAVAARVDWNAVAGALDSTATQIAGHAKTNSASEVAIMAITPDGDTVPIGGERDVDTALASLRSGLVAEGVKVPWTATVTDEQWASDQCQLFGCPDHSLPDKAEFSLAAEYVYSGVSPAESREAIAASVEPSGHMLHDSAWLMPGPQEPPAVWEAWRNNAIDSSEQLLRDGVEPSDTQAQELASGLRDTRVRDTILFRLTDDASDPQRWNKAWDVLASTLQRANHSDVAAVGATAAVAGWQANNGVLANVALDRTFAADPDHSLGGLVRQALDAALPPSSWEQAMAGTSEFECRNPSKTIGDPLAAPSDTNAVSSDPLASDPLTTPPLGGDATQNTVLGADPLLEPPSPPTGPDAPSGPKL